MGDEELKQAVRKAIEISKNAQKAYEQLLDTLRRIEEEETNKPRS